MSIAEKNHFAEFNFLAYNYDFETKINFYLVHALKLEIYFIQ